MVLAVKEYGLSGCVGVSFSCRLVLRERHLSYGDVLVCAVIFIVARGLFPVLCFRAGDDVFELLSSGHGVPYSSVGVDYRRIVLFRVFVISRCKWISMGWVCVAGSPPVVTFWVVFVRCSVGSLWIAGLVDNF